MMFVSDSIHATAGWARSAMALVLVLSVVALWGCGGSQLETDDFNDPDGFQIAPEASIEETPDNRAILEAVKKYRDAVEQKNVTALKEVVAREYYENASTTDDINDDYGNEKLDELFSYYLGEKVQEVRYDVQIMRVQREANTARVDYNYFWQFRYVVDGRDHWESGRDTNRLTLVEENGSWKIASGL